MSVLPGRRLGEDALPERRAWDDEEDEGWTPTPLEPLVDDVDTVGAPPGGRGDAWLLAPVTRAATTLVRLDERLSRSPGAVRAGWAARLVVEDAAAAARLDHHPKVTPRALRDLDLGIVSEPPNPDMAKAYLILAMLRHILRRSPRHLFRPSRLLASAGYRRPAVAATPGSPRPPHAWVDLFIPDREEIRGALLRALDPVLLDAMAQHQPLIAGARFVEHWHRCGAAALLGGTLGRQLAGAWLTRSGLLAAHLPLMNVGWLAARDEYLPEDPATWPRRFADAMTRAAERGLQLHRNLESWHGRLQGAAAEAGKTSALQRAVDVLVAHPGLSAAGLAGALGITPRAAQTLLDALNRRGLVADITARKAFRVWASPETL